MSGRAVPSPLPPAASSAGPAAPRQGPFWARQAATQGEGAGWPVARKSSGEGAPWAEQLWEGRPGPSAGEEALRTPPPPGKPPFRQYASPGLAEPRFTQQREYSSFVCHLELWWVSLAGRRAGSPRGMRGGEVRLAHPNLSSSERSHPWDAARGGNGGSPPGGGIGCLVSPEAQAKCGGCLRWGAFPTQAGVHLERMSPHPRVFFQSVLAALQNGTWAPGREGDPGAHPEEAKEAPPQLGGRDLSCSGCLGGGWAAAPRERLWRGEETGN